MKLLIIISLLLSSRLVAQQYVSPGINFGYAFGEGLSFKFKVSFGSTIDTDKFGVDSFANITFGHGFIYNKDTPFKSHTFYEVQFGTTLLKNEPIFTGIGFGHAFFKYKNEDVVCPKYSIFTGFLAYANIDIIEYKEKPYYDFNLEFSFPLINNAIINL